jgi:acid phosphatase
MTADGHDTSVTVAGQFLKGFLTPLLENKNFLQNTLLLITFDQNKVVSVLLGDAVPDDLVGTTDNNNYYYYSELATVEANWSVPLPPCLLLSPANSPQGPPHPRPL